MIQTMFASQRLSSISDRLNLFSSIILFIILLKETESAITELSICGRDPATHHHLCEESTIGLLIAFPAHARCHFTVNISHSYTNAHITIRGNDTYSRNAVLLVSDSPNYDQLTDRKVNLFPGRTEGYVFNTGYQQERTVYFLLLNTEDNATVNYYITIYFTSYPPPTHTTPHYNEATTKKPQTTGRTIGLAIAGIALLIIIILGVVVKTCVRHSTEPNLDAIFSADNRNNGHVSLTINNENREPLEYTESLQTENDQTISANPDPSQNFPTPLSVDPTLPVDPSTPDDPPPSYESLLTRQTATLDHVYT